MFESKIKPGVSFDNSTYYDVWSSRSSKTEGIKFEFLPLYATLRSIID